MIRRRYSNWSLHAFSLCLCASVVPSLQAHPVPSFAYDRAIQVKLTAEFVEVAYQLNLDEITIFRDVTQIVDDNERARLRLPKEFYEAFSKAVAPLLADRLEAFQNDAALTFVCTGRVWRIEDHVRFDFVIRAKWPAPASPGQSFRFQETNYENQKGQIDLSFAADQGFELANRREPDAALKALPSIERSDEQSRQVRSLAATLATRAEPADLAIKAPKEETPALSWWKQVRQRGPVALLDSQSGFAVILILVGIFGAAHALTPGHGKTLVAAYLVGEHGTVAHAFLLGLITTITHTGMVLAISVALALSVGISPERLQSALGFIGGLLIAGLGLWLLLRRLSGQADHFHIGGGHHHHHGDHAHQHTPADTGRPRFWNLLVLGIGGGLIPCWDAMTLEMAVIANGRLWLGPPLVFAFSVGLAATLVFVGVAVVKLKNFGASRFGSGKLIKALPFASATVIAVIGLWLCFDAVAK